MPDVIYMPSCAARKWLEIDLGLDLQENLILSLFTNDLTIDDDTVAGDFVELTGHGYSPKTLNMSSWSAPAWDAVNKQAYSVQPEQKWTFTADTLAYVRGWRLCMATTGTLLLACKFGAPKPYENANETCTVTPRKNYGLKVEEE